MSEPTQAMVTFRDPTLEDTLSLAKVFVASGWFKDTRSISQGITKILAGRELGFGNIASLSGVYIVEGKPALSANLIAAAVKRSGKYNYRIREHTPQCCRIEFFEDGESVGCSEFTWQDAEAAKVAHKATWQQYPRNMLFARAMSNGARWYCADVFAGSTPYTPEELGADETVDETGATHVSSEPPPVPRAMLEWAPEPDAEPVV